MSVVSLLGVKILNNPAAFTAPYEFEITFECLEQLQNDLEWKLTYVGSATTSEYDQELDSLLVGPIPVGINKFVFEADPPSVQRIPDSDVIGVTVILLTCSYAGREFVRVGYYVNNEYDDPELAENPPAKPVIERVRRNVLAEKPRVTKFAIKWDSEESAPAEFPPEQPEADNVDDDGTAYGAEEEEEELLEEELEEEGAKAVPVEGEDAEMGGAEDVAGPSHAVAADGKHGAEGEDAGAESEDLEAESEGSEEEEEEEEEAAEGEGEAADEEMDMGDEGKGHGVQKPMEHADHSHDAMMVH